jgi:hypothetical protein
VTERGETPRFPHPARMTGPDHSGAPDDLNFDRAEAGSGSDTAAPNQCANCGKPLGSTYHTANGAPICSSCRGRLATATAPLRDPVTLAKALVFGFGAAIVGAIIYYAVMRYLNLEIGLVAILTGWMVGKAMSKATAGRGGRLVQVSAGLLTYVSVAMAYFPFAIQQMGEAAETAITTPPPPDTFGTERLVDSATVAAMVDSMAAAAAANPSAAQADPLLTEEERREALEGPRPEINPIVGFVVVAGIALALPVLVILGSMPGGLISAAIIGFGIVQAWQLTGAPKLVFEGPFKLAGSGGDADRDGASG